MSRSVYHSEVDDRKQKIAFRLALEIPLTNWPVLIWIAAQGDFLRGRHNQSALSALGNLDYLSCLLTTLLGFIVLLTARQPRYNLPWLLIALLNHCAQFIFIQEYHYMYA